MEMLVTAVLIVATIYGSFMTYTITASNLWAWLIYKAPAIILMLGGALSVLYKFGFVLVVAI